MWLHKFIPQPVFGNAGVGSEGGSGTGVGIGSGDRGYGGFGESQGYGGGGRAGDSDSGGGGGYGGNALGGSGSVGLGVGDDPGKVSVSRSGGFYGGSSKSPGMQTGAQAGTGFGIGSGDRGYGGFGEGVGFGGTTGPSDSTGAGASGQAGVGGFGSGAGSGPSGAQARAAAAAAGRNSLATSAASRNPVTRSALAPPAPPTPRAMVKAPTISAPTLAQLTALANAKATQASMAMVDDPSLAAMPGSLTSLDADTQSRVGGLVGNLASTAAAASKSGRPGAVGTPGVSGGFSAPASLADAAASQSTSGRAGGVGTPGVGGGFGGNSSGGRAGGVGTPGVGGGFDGPSFSGGPQGSISSNIGNSVLGQSRSNVISGQQDPSTNAVGFSAARGILDSRLGALNNQLNNNAAMQVMEALGVPTLASSPQADLARGQFRAENPLGSRPTAEVTVNTARDVQEPSISLSPETLAEASRIAKEARDQREQAMRDTIAAGASRNMAEEPMGLLSSLAAQNREQANPYGAPTQRDTNAAQQAYGTANLADLAASINSQQAAANRASTASNAGVGSFNQGLASEFDDPMAAQRAQIARSAFGLPETMTNQQIGRGLLNAQTREAQKRQRTAEIGGLLSGMGETSSPASARTNEEMPGSVRDNMQGFGLVNRLRESIRQGALGGAPTDGQGETQQFDGEFTSEDFVDFSENPNVVPEIRDRYANRRAPVTIRNNNMGAISIVGRNSWVTRLPGFVGTTPRPRSEGGSYAQFATPEHGVYAASELLRRYGAGGRDTVDAIVNRWAVDSNDNYKNHVVQSLRDAGFEVDVDTQLDLEDPEVRKAILKAKSGFESGTMQPVYTDETFDAGIAGQFNNALMAGQIGGDLNLDELWGSGISDEDASKILAEQQGYSQTEEGAWTDGAQTFSDPMEAVKSLPLMTQLQLLIWSNRGSVAPSSRERQGGGNPVLDQSTGLLTGFMNGSSGTGSGGGSGGAGGGTGAGTGNGTNTGGPPNFVPPTDFDPRGLGLLFRPYSNPFSVNQYGDPRNPWTWAA